MAKIINAHIHLGGSFVTDSCYTEEQLLKNMEDNHIDGMVVLPLAEPTPDNFEGHNRIYRFAQQHPGKIWGVCDMHPRHPEEVYCNEVRRCVKELGFVALKLHPLLHGVNPMSGVADKAYRIADELNIPLMVHTGLGVTHSPALYIKKAQQYPNLKIILCHAGTMDKANEAILAAQMCPNIYLEPSWCPSHYIERMIKTIGADRVIMGSDGLPSTAIELAKARNMNVSEEDREKFMGLNAIKVYNLK